MDKTVVESVEESVSSFTLSHKIMILVIIIAVLLYSIYKALARHNQTSRFYSEQISDHEEEAFSSSIRLPDHY